MASFLPLRDLGYRRGAYAGTIGFGYWMVLIYSTEIAGFMIRTKWDGHIGFLVMGLLLIGVGTVSRLREAFLCLSNQRVRPESTSSLPPDEIGAPTTPTQLRSP